MTHANFVFSSSSSQIEPKIIQLPKLDSHFCLDLSFRDQCAISPNFPLPTHWKRRPENALNPSQPRNRRPRRKHSTFPRTRRRRKRRRVNGDENDDDDSKPQQNSSLERTETPPTTKNKTTSGEELKTGSQRITKRR